MRVSRRRGDTLIEVMFSITIFALIAVIAVNLMNGGIYTAQKSLEVSMARNEIDAQSEALRFIQNSYLAEKELLTQNRQFEALWYKLTKVGNNVVQTPSAIAEDREIFDINNLSTCSDAYREDGTGQIYKYNAFVVNTRLIMPGTEAQLSADGILLDDMIVGAARGDKKLGEAGLYPRVLYDALGMFDPNNENSSWGDLLERKEEYYRKIAVAEGIWIIVVRGGKNADDPSVEPEYFDFYIRTCWHSIGRNAPSTIGSIVRLYNPEVVD